MQARPSSTITINVKFRRSTILVQTTLSVRMMNVTAIHMRVITLLYLYPVSMEKHEYKLLPLPLHRRAEPRVMWCEFFCQ